MSIAKIFRCVSIFDAKTDLIKKRAWSAIDLLTPWCEHIRLGMEDEGDPADSDHSNGHMPGYFSATAKDHALCTQYGLDPDKSSFIYWQAGELERRAISAYAAKVLKRQGRTNFQIAITGRGAQLDNLKIIANPGCKKKWCLPAFAVQLGTSATWPIVWYYPVCRR